MDFTLRLCYCWKICTTLSALHSSILVCNIFRINMLKDGAALHTVPPDAHARECLNITGFPRGQGNHSLCLRNCMTQRDKDNGKAQVANVCVCVSCCCTCYLVRLETPLRGILQSNTALRVEGRSAYIFHSRMTDVRVFSSYMFSSPHKHNVHRHVYYKSVHTQNIQFSWNCINK